MCRAWMGKGKETEWDPVSRQREERELQLEMPTENAQSLPWKQFLKSQAGVTEERTPRGQDRRSGKVC